MISLRPISSSPRQLCDRSRVTYDSSRRHGDRAGSTRSLILSSYLIGLGLKTCRVTYSFRLLPKLSRGSPSLLPLGAGGNAWNDGQTLPHVVGNASEDRQLPTLYFLISSISTSPSKTPIMAFQEDAPSDRLEIKLAAPGSPAKSRPDYSTAAKTMSARKRK